MILMDNSSNQGSISDRESPGINEGSPEYEEDNKSEYDGENKMEESEEESEEERMPRKSERVRKRTTILTYDEMGGDPKQIYRLSIIR